ENCGNGLDDDCDGATDCLDTNCVAFPLCVGCSACMGATNVVSPGGRYDVVLGPHVQTGSCGGTGSEAYLSFTLVAASDVFIATHGSGLDTKLYVRSCTCSGTEVDCNDDADGLTSSRLTLTNLAAGTYNVIVDTNAAMSATVSVDVYVSSPGVASDRCGNPTFIPAGAAMLSGDSCTYASDYDMVTDTVGCQYPGGGDGPDRVFYFYLPTARTVAFNGCNGATTYDSTVFIRSVCSDGVAAANQLACNDDGCGGGPSCTARYRSAQSDIMLGPGLYYLFVDGYGSMTCPCGAYGFTLTGF
ncbi:MAG: putative lipoprotein, partial [Acidimicrobiaceae bacterium]